MRLHLNSIRCGTVIALIIATAAPAAYAKSKETDTQALLKALEKQSQRIESGERALAGQQQKIAAERAEFEALKAKVEALTGKTIKKSGKSAAQRPLVGAVPQDGANVPGEVGTDRKQSSDKPPDVAKYIEEGGVLLPKGKVEIAPSLEYDRISATTVAIQGFSIIPALNIGLFEISQVNRDVLIGAVQARVGVTDRIELEAKVPYVYGRQTTTGRQAGVGATDNTTSSLSGQALGDVEVGAHYQINRGQEGWPYFIGNIRYKSTTGTGPFEKPPNSFGLQTELATGSGFAAVQPSVTMIYPSDPVVFYSNLGYVHNFSESYPGYGDIQPGSAVNASFGMSLALNDEASVSLGYSHSMVFRTMVNNEFIQGSYDLQVGSLDLGYSYSLSDWMAINLSIGAGLTADAPDDRVIVRVPMTFDVF
jgi:hypothetical protein